MVASSVVMERILWIVLLFSSAVAAAQSVDVESLDDLSHALASVTKQEDGESTYQINIKVQTLSKHQSV